MDPKDAAMLFLMFIVFGVPVLALTARMVLKPIVEAIVRLRESSGSARVTDSVANRVLELEDEVRQLRASVTSLEQTVDFQQKLLTAPAEPVAPSP
jgi:plasmid replication initiation protein